MARALTFASPGRTALLLVGLIIAVRAWLAFVTPLTFDETYYWLWSRHLAIGYYDHPPMVAWMIRLGTDLFGASPFAVRALPLLFSIPASWAVWRAAQLLFHDETLAARAPVYFNLMLMVSVGFSVATPDAPLLLCAAVTLYLLTQILRTGGSIWWLALGVCLGLGLVSKYTTLFMGFSVLLWVLLVPAQRRWLATPWPYVGASIAVAFFAPVIWWNAQHDYVSFIKQFGRAGVHQLTLKYLPDYLGSQALLITPPLFVLGVAGIARCLRANDHSKAERMLLASLILPLVIYFAWHALHARVGGNWLLPIYPALAVAAAWAATPTNLRRITRWSRTIAIPLGMAVLILAALFATAPLQTLPGLRSYLDKQLGDGWAELAPHIDALRIRTGATAILTSSYSMTGVLSYYLKSETPVVEIIEPKRWLGFDRPALAELHPPFLYVTEANRAFLSPFPMEGMDVTRIATLSRMAHGRAIAQIELYRVTKGARLTTR